MSIGLVGELTSIVHIDAFVVLHQSARSRQSVAYHLVNASQLRRVFRVRRIEDSKDTDSLLPLHVVSDLPLGILATHLIEEIAVTSL